MSTLAVAQTTPNSSTQEVEVEWQGYNNDNSVVDTEAKDFAQLRSKFFNVPDTSYVKLDATKKLDNFTSALDHSIGKLDGKRKGIVRIIVNSHGSPDKFWIDDGKSSVNYDDFVKSIAAELKKAKVAPSQVELYLSPCYSGTIIPALNRYLSKTQFPNTQIIAWIGSAPDKTTILDEYGTAMLQMQTAESAIKKFLSPVNVCQSVSVGVLFQSLGGESHSKYWTNAQPVIPELNQTELEALSQADDEFYKSRALFALIDRREESPQMTAKMLKMVNDSSQSTEVRSLSIQYLSAITPSPPTVAAAFSTIAHTPSGQIDSWIKKTAIEALGKVSPDSSTEMLSMFHDKSQEPIIRQAALTGFLNTKKPATGIIQELRSLASTGLDPLSGIALNSLVDVDPEAETFFRNLIQNKASENARMQGYGGLEQLESSQPNKLAQDLIQAYQAEKGNEDTTRFLLNSMGNLVENSPDTRDQINAVASKDLLAYVAMNTTSTDQVVQDKVSSYRYILSQLGD